MTKICCVADSTSRESIYRHYAFGALLYPFFSLAHSLSLPFFGSVSVNPRRRRRRCSRGMIHSDRPWEKLSVRSLARDAAGGRYRRSGRRVQPHGCLCASPWVRAMLVCGGFDGDDTEVERGFTSTWSRAADGRWECASSGVFCFAPTYLPLTYLPACAPHPRPSVSCTLASYPTHRVPFFSASIKITHANTLESGDRPPEGWVLTAFT